MNVLAQLALVDFSELFWLAALRFSLNGYRHHQSGKP
jgi:hypothetical protein